MYLSLHGRVRCRCSHGTVPVGGREQGGTGAGGRGAVCCGSADGTKRGSSCELPPAAALDRAEALLGTVSKLAPQGLGMSGMPHQCIPHLCITVEAIGESEHVGDAQGCQARGCHDAFRSLIATAAAEHEGGPRLASTRCCHALLPLRGRLRRRGACRMWCWGPTTTYCTPPCGAACRAVGATRVSIWCWRAWAHLRAQPQQWRRENRRRHGTYKPDSPGHH